MKFNNNNVIVFKDNTSFILNIENLNSKFNTEEINLGEYEIRDEVSNLDYNINISDISIEQNLEIIKKEYDNKKNDFIKLCETNGYGINSLIKYRSNKNEI